MNPHEKILAAAGRAARRAPGPADESAPFGFSTRVAALAFEAARRRRRSSAGCRCGRGVACLLAARAVARQLLGDHRRVRRRAPVAAATTRRGGRQHGLLKSMAKTWQVILATIAIFVAGLVTGGATALGVVRWVVHHRGQRDDGPRRIARAPATPSPSSSAPSSCAACQQLDLTDDQRQRSCRSCGAPPRSSPRPHRGAAHRPAIEKMQDEISAEPHARAAGRSSRSSSASSGPGSSSSARTQPAAPPGGGRAPRAQVAAEIGVARPRAAHVAPRPGAMHGQAREPRQGRKAATVPTSYQCRGVPGHFIFLKETMSCPPTRSSRANGGRRRSTTSSARTTWCARCGTPSRRGPHRARLPAGRPAGHGQDLDREDLRQGAQLHRRPERRL
jgi:hypothetical protein